MRKRRWIGKEPKKSIEERSIECTDRESTGHWERDLVEGIRGHSALLVIVDRKSKLGSVADNNDKVCYGLDEYFGKGL